MVRIKVRVNVRVSLPDRHTLFSLLAISWHLRVQNVTLRLCHTSRHTSLQYAPAKVGCIVKIGEI